MRGIYQPARVQGAAKVADAKRVAKEPKTFARQQLLADIPRFVRTNLTAVLVVMLVTAVIIAFESLFFRGVVLGSIAGVVATTFVTSFGLMYLMYGGGYYRLGGAWAEEFTRDELKKAKRRGDVWAFVNGIRLGSQDIDHIVLSPAGVVAIDSKWHFRFEDGYLRADIVKATQAAAKARSVLTSLKQRHEVTPLVVVAGPGRTELIDEPQRIDDVDVIAINDLGGWLASRNTGRFPKDQAEQLAAQLTEFRSKYA